MLVALVWAMVITACAASSHGDNCVHVGKIKHTKPSVYCDGKDSDSCSASKCDCMNCCMDDPKATCDSCCKTLKKTESCNSGDEYSEDKDLVKIVVGEFQEKCCKKAPTPPDTCNNMDIVNKAVKIGTFCDVTKETVPTAKFDTAVMPSGTDYEKNCCAAKIKCGSFTCSKAGTKPVAETTECSTIPCEAQDCCEADTTKCFGLLGEGCGTGYFADEAKYGESATKTTYDDTCCTAMAKCEDFYASTNIGQTSASTQQHAVTLSLLLAVLAAMGKHL